jgi:hypothetical protein
MHTVLHRMIVEHVETAREPHSSLVYLLIPKVAARLVICTTAAFLILVSLAPQQPTWAQVDMLPPAFVVLGPDHIATARAITTEPRCPAIELDGLLPLPMAVRAPPAEPDFPVLVCETPIPPGTARAVVAGQALALPLTDGQRILVLGDTGCRLKAGDPIQACDSPRAWPFAAVSTGAALSGPDLVIHVGDYLYREMPCPAENAGCAGSPFGDNWAAWEADFFGPAAPLLRAAPWVMTRGDHELCARAGSGFFRFLDPRPLTEPCRDMTEPYAVQAGELRLVVMDVSDAADADPTPDSVAAYAAQFATVRTLTSGRSWLVMHKPLWALRPAAPGPADGQELTSLNPTLQAASNNTLPPGIELVLSGHIHLFEALDFADERPPQLVLGTGGTLLDPEIIVSLEGTALAGTTVANGLSVAHFGFTTLEWRTGILQATLHNRRGAARVVCSVISAGIHCRR